MVRIRDDVAGEADEDIEYRRRLVYRVFPKNVGRTRLLTRINTGRAKFARIPAMRGCQQIRRCFDVNEKAADALSKPIRRFPVLIATLVALRALVPVGYMLSLPADASFELALHLCPTQNPTLDLGHLSASDGTGISHHEHSGDSGDNADTDITVAVSPDCNAWLGSAAIAVATLPATLVVDHEPVLPPNDYYVVRARITRAYASLPRAPPGVLA